MANTASVMVAFESDESTRTQEGNRALVSRNPLA